MIKYEGMEFDSIRTFDCVTLSFSGGTGGNYTTWMPISDKNYRDEQTSKGRKMRAKVEVFKQPNHTRFDITDDWGTIFTVVIDNIHKTEIQTAINKAKEYGLLN